MSTITFLTEVLELQIDDIHQFVKRKKMNSPLYHNMTKRHDTYLQRLPEITRSDRRYAFVYKHSEYMFTYVVSMLFKDAQRKGSKEIIRVRDWHKSSIGYKNSLRNIMSSRMKQILTEYFPLPYDPDNPALINYGITKTYIKSKKKTRWTIDGQDFIPEHPHVLILELAELYYPGLMILATEFEFIEDRGLQFSTALRLLTDYLDDVCEVIDYLYHKDCDHQCDLYQLLQVEHISRDDVLDFLKSSREQIIEEARMLSLRYPKRNRMSTNTTEVTDYLSCIEFDLLDKQLSEKLTDKRIIRIQKKTTDLSATRSSRFHSDIVFLNEYAGNTSYQQFLQEPTAFEFHSWILGAEIRVYYNRWSGSIDLVIGEYDNTMFRPLLIIDRKAVSRYHLSFEERSDANQRGKNIEPVLTPEPYGTDFSSIVKSTQILAKERSFYEQLKNYERGIHKFHPDTWKPILAVLYFDAGYEDEKIAHDEKQLILSAMDNLDIYHGSRLVLHHPELSTVRLVLLGGRY